MAYAGSQRLQGAGNEPHEARDAPTGQPLLRSIGNEREWGAEPNVGRVANGVPKRVDRLRCLGNSVVPQIVEIIGKAIIEREGGR